MNTEALNTFMSELTERIARTNGMIEGGHDWEAFKFYNILRSDLAMIWDQNEEARVGNGSGWYTRTVYFYDPQDTDPTSYFDGSALIDTLNSAQGPVRKLLRRAGFVVSDLEFVEIGEGKQMDGTGTVRNVSIIDIMMRLA